MGTALKPSSIFLTRNYYLLTKPGIVLGNIITTIGGFVLASKATIDLKLLLATILGLSLIVSSACVFNNYIDRESDKKMNRTKNRVLAKGLISVKQAIVFAFLLVTLGSTCLILFVNPLTVFIALSGFVVYVILYSFSKYYSIHGTLIGSFAGAVPPIVGYCAVSNQLDLGALMLFIIMITWQMPHFFSIAIMRLEDYMTASIPILPVKKGIHATKRHMMCYIGAFIAASFMLTALKYTGYFYLITAASLGIIWFCLCVQGFNCSNDKNWAQKMFRFSLIVIMALCITIHLDQYLYLNSSIF